MKPLFVIVAWPTELVQECRVQKQERVQAAELGIVQGEGKDAGGKRGERKQTPPAAKPALEAVPAKVREMLADDSSVSDFEPIEHKQVFLEGSQRKMMQLYRDTEDEIAELEAAGAVVLGVWSTHTGERLRDMHPEFGKFMPPRLESTTGEDGVSTSIEVDDEVPRPLNLLYGQASPVYE